MGPGACAFSEETAGKPPLFPGSRYGSFHHPRSQHCLSSPVWPVLLLWPPHVAHWSCRLCRNARFDAPPGQSPSGHRRTPSGPAGWWAPWSQRGGGLLPLQSGPASLSTSHSTGSRKVPRTGSRTHQARALAFGGNPASLEEVDVQVAQSFTTRADQCAPFWLGSTCADLLCTNIPIDGLLQATQMAN